MKQIRRILSILVITATLLSLTAVFAAAETPATFTSQTAAVGGNESMNYWLFTPKDAKPGMPLVVYLHGMSQKGDDISKLPGNGLCKWVSEGKFDDVPAYLVFPQLSASYQGWKDVTKQLKTLIDSVVTTYAIDAGNVNLTGHSMGGIGTYAVANEYPELFSAIAPLSGSIVKNDGVVSHLSGMALWAFVAAEDRYISPNASISLVETLWNSGANARVTILDGATHFTVPELVYLDRETDLLGWLISADKPRAEQASKTVKVESTGTSEGGSKGGARGGKSSSGGKSGQVPASMRQIKLKIGEKTATVFGKTAETDAAPLIRNGRTMLPARFVSEKLGATVTWDAAKPNEVVITKKSTTILILIGSETATVNDKTVTLDSPAFVENGRTYCPLRFICENLGASVEWNAETQEVTITRGANLSSSGTGKRARKQGSSGTKTGG